MSTATRPAITKPRKSQLILEGTTALVSSVLLAWLLLWFLRQHSNPFRVMAYHVQAPTVGAASHLEADVRGLTKHEGGGTVEPVEPTSLMSRVPALATTPGPALVVSISAPTLGARPDWDAAELVKRVAKAAKRDVLIVLDLAQVDSDRELAVFGNAPHKKLAEALEGVKSSKNVFVLTSCAPGQKSWMIDGLGRSAFSYFLQVGLAGEARPVDDRGVKSTLTVEGLHQFVLRNTAQWVKDHRREAIQTPTLRKVGGSPDAKSPPTPLPPLDVKAPARPGSALLEKAGLATPKGPTAAPPAGDSATKPAPEKGGGAEAKPREPLLAALLEEWRRREELDASNLPPYRVAPARWRIYEAHLLRAERLLRASWHDPNLREAAEQALARASQRREELATALAAARRPDDEFPFHPARGDSKGEPILNASLKYVTGRASEELSSGTSSASPAEATPARPAKVVVEKVADPLPPPLRDAAVERPARYLELQLPAWALMFHETFVVETFKDDARGGLLREAVLKRLPAESALARNRLGLHWIVDEIRKGDEIRREVQDGLFGVADRPGATAEIKLRIAEYGRRYAEAAERIERFHQARILFEKIAARLPYYGEWAVLDEAQPHASSGGPKDDSASPRLSEVFNRAARLGDAIGRSARPEDLAEVHDQAAESFQKLESEYVKAVEDLANGDRTIGWNDLDDILSTPLILVRERKTLLEKVLKLEAEEPERLPASRPAGAAVEPVADAGPAIDPGFARRGLGLARLDVQLRTLGGGDKADDEVAKLDKLVAEVAELLGRKGDGTNAPAIVEAFDRVSGQARRASDDFTTRSDRSGRVARGTEEGIGADLRALDRAARFRTSEELYRLQADADLASRRLEAFARRVSLRFHAERLTLDFARGVGALYELASREFPIEDVGPAPIVRGYLVADVPAEPIEIDPVKHTARLPVGATRVDDDTSTGKIPRGRAFVGVRESPSGPRADGAEKKDDVQLKVSLDRSPTSFGPGMAGGLYPIETAPPESLTFVVEQLTSADADAPPKFLSVKIFYRGRVNDERGKEVAVACRDFGPAVVLKIEQDRVALARLYTQRIADGIRDQFEEHPGVGYLHCRGQLDFILTVQNRTTELKDLIVERTLSLKDGKDVNQYSPLVISRLAPQREFRVPSDRLSAEEVPIDKPMVLKVRVYEARGKKLVASQDYTFEQLKLEDYLVVSPFQGYHVFAGDRDKTLAFQIRIARKISDPVTEPILLGKVKVAIDRMEPVPRWKDDPEAVLNRIVDDNAVVVRFKNPDGRVEIPWIVEVDGQVWKK